MKRVPIGFVTAVCLAFSASYASAADWPQFRGPGGSGVSKDKGLPVAWSADRNVAWKTALPGPGASSPIVVGGRIFLTCYSGYAEDRLAGEPGDIKNLKRHLMCLDRNGGKQLWAREVAAAQPEAAMQTFLNLHGYASSTPIADGKHVYVFFGRTGVFAFDMEGKEVWKADVGTRTDNWGSGTSPVLYKELVIVNAGVESGALVALDKNTGKEMWRAKDISESWSTPILVNVAGRTELVVSASHKILGFDPDSGKELWHSDSYDWYVCPSLVAHDGVVFGLQNNACVAVKAGGRGDVTKTHTLWQKNFGDVVVSPVYHDGHIYWASGTAYCVRANDGTVVHKERLKPDSDRIYASPVLADGKIYYVSREQGTYVVAAGPKYKLLAHNTLGDTSIFNGSPAVSNSQLLLRSDRFLYCIGKGAKPKPPEQTFRDANRHFTLELPNGWKAMSSQELDLSNAFARQLKTQGTIHYIAGFRPGNTSPGTFPYILVQSQPGATTYDAIERGLAKGKESLKKVEGPLGQIAKNLSIGSSVLDRTRNRIIQRMQMEVIFVGKVQALSIGHLGAEGILSLHC
jgi:outer membrane protein assembly factor BamB